MANECKYLGKCLDDDIKSLILKSFDEHKWYLSESNGDVGIDFAIKDFVNKHYLLAITLLARYNLCNNVCELKNCSRKGHLNEHIESILSRTNSYPEIIEGIIEDVDSNLKDLINLIPAE